jgi:hypothetical protein
MERASIHLELPWRHLQCDEKRDRGNQTWQAGTPNRDLEGPAPSFMEPDPGGSLERRGRRCCFGAGDDEPWSKLQCLETPQISVPAMRCCPRRRFVVEVALLCPGRAWLRLEAARPLISQARFQGHRPHMARAAATPPLPTGAVGWLPALVGLQPCRLIVHPQLLSTSSRPFHPDALTPAPLRLAIQKRNEPCTILD